MPQHFHRSSTAFVIDRNRMVVGRRITTRKVGDVQGEMEDDLEFEARRKVRVEALEASSLTFANAESTYQQSLSGRLRDIPFAE